MDWPASDASVYAMIPFRKLRRSVSTKKRRHFKRLQRGYGADKNWRFEDRHLWSRPGLRNTIRSRTACEVGLSGNLPGRAYASYRNPRFTEASSTLAAG